MAHIICCMMASPDGKITGPADFALQQAEQLEDGVLWMGYAVKRG
jgi:hypothetical protein